MSRKGCVFEVCFFLFSTTNKTKTKPSAELHMTHALTRTRLLDSILLKQANESRRWVLPPSHSHISLSVADAEAREGCEGRHQGRAGEDQSGCEEGPLVHQDQVSHCTGSVPVGLPVGRTWGWGAATSCGEDLGLGAAVQTPAASGSTGLLSAWVWINPADHGLPALQGWRFRPRAPGSGESLRITGWI